MKKRFILAIFLVAVALASALAIPPSHASGTTTLSIDSATQQFPSANVGDTIQVNITISNVQSLWAWDISELSFNPAYLNITDVTEGPFLKAAGQSLFIWTSNSPNWYAIGIIPDISDTLLEYSTKSGSGVLATLTFKVVALGTSEIVFNQTTLDSSTFTETSTGIVYQQISDTTTNANIVVGGNTSGPSPSPTSGPTTAPSVTSLPTSSSPSPDPTTSGTPSPTATPTTQQAPEFPVFSVLLTLIIATTISTLLLTKKAKLNKK